MISQYIQILTGVLIATFTVLAFGWFAYLGGGGGQ